MDALKKPLLPVEKAQKDNESPRQKRNRIIRDFQEAAFDTATLIGKLTPEYLAEIESLPESYIDAIVAFSFSPRRKRHITRRSFDAFLSKFSELGEKTKKVVAAHAFKLFNEKKISYVKLTNEIMFFHADQLAKKSANYGAVRKFFFYRSNKRALTSLMPRVVKILTPRGNVANPALGLLALQVDEFEQYKQACLRLEQLPHYLKDVFFRSLYFVPSDLQGDRAERMKAAEKIGEAIGYVVSHENCKDLFPNLSLFFAQVEVRAKFGNSLRSINLKSFQAVIATINSVNQLQSILLCVMDEIETSVFKGKYEDMMELCLVRLMALSDPKEGLNLDPELLKKCLGILNNYFWTSNRRAFLMTPDTGRAGECVAKNLPLFYFIQRRLRDHPDVFANYPKVRELTVHYNDAFERGALPQSEEDFQRALENALVRFDVQALFQRYLLEHSGSPVTTSLIRYYGADINAVRSDGKRLFLWLIELNGELQERGETYNKYSDAIHVLLQEGVTVMQEDVDAAEKINSHAGRHLLGRLQAKLRQQPLQVAIAVSSSGNGAVVEKDKEEKEENQAPDPSDSALQRLTGILEHEYYSVDVNPLVKVLAGRADELEELKGQLYLHELTPEAIKILGQDPFAEINASGGKSQRAAHLRSLQWILSAESNGAEIADADELLRKVGSAVKELAPTEVRKLCACNLSSDMQGFLSANFVYFELFWSLTAGKQSFALAIPTALKSSEYYEATEALLLTLKEGEVLEGISQEELQDFWATAIDKGRSDVLRVLVARGVDVNPMLLYAKTGTINEQIVNVLEEQALMFLEGVLLRGEQVSEESLNITVRLLGKNIDLLTWPEKKALGKRNLEEPTLKMLRENGFEKYLSNQEDLIDVGAMAAIRDREAKPAEQAANVPGTQPVATQAPK